MYPCPAGATRNLYKAEAHPLFGDDQIIAAEESCQSHKYSSCNMLPPGDVSPASAISFVIPSPDKVSPSFSNSFCIPDTLRLPHQQHSLQSIRTASIMQEHIYPADISPASSESLSVYDTSIVDLPVITVITLNVFGNMGKHLQTKLNQLCREEPLADIMCLQEAPVHNKKIDVPERYEEIYLEGPASHESMALWKLKTSLWEVEKTTALSTKHCYTLRESFITTLRYGNTKLVLSHLHMCGGKFDEKFHGRESVTRIKQTKEETVISAVKCKSDIILGDFNSDLMHYLTGSALNSHREFLKSNGYSIKKINAWNTIPYRFLANHNYQLVKNKKKTSFYGGTPDSIWHLPRLKLETFSVVDMGISSGRRPSDGYSDHNGIKATFVVCS